ncbi:MAG: Eco57I restriction-modification methylase domain-containing protein, partial [Bacteroidales bacterium]|nr:Eco57I restriction-modification methylase domain-containing protein [Bacteroidales bacterium]
QLSLYLKLLEDETTATANEMMVLFHEKILPDMSKNIICGNSLIGTDILTDSLITGEEERKLNPLNFETAFPEVFKDKKEQGYIFVPDIGIDEEQDTDTDTANEPMIPYKKRYKGGFDAIIGNPPYVRIHLIDKIIVNYFNKNFNVAKGQFDLYSIFIEKAINLLKDSGKFGYIIPRFIKFNLDSEFVRKFLLEYTLDSLTETGKAFEEANTECIISILTKKKSNINDKLYINEYYPQTSISNIKIINQNFFKKLPSYIFNTIISYNEYDIIAKIQSNSYKLEEVAKVKRGMEIGKAFIRNTNQGDYKTLLGEEVNRYNFVFKNTYCNQNKEIIRLKGFAENDKVLIRRVATKLIATYDESNCYFIKNLYGLKSDNINLKYLLGLINSSLLSFFLIKYYTTKKEEIFPEIQVYQLNGLPIKKIDFQNKIEKDKHDKLVQLVEQMINAKKQLQSAKTERDKSYFELRCIDLDRQIDMIVYELYDLTPDEIDIVEGR